MPQKYKVFFNHNVVYVSCLSERSNANFSSITNPDEEELEQIIKFLSGSVKNIELHIFFDDLHKGWKLFKKQFKVKKAAGGLVLNADNHILFIKRKGLWDLPKGHMEKGEKKKECALREVSEECGIYDLEIQHSLVNTYHTYKLDGKMVLKCNYWYLMKYFGSSKLVPQTEEHITSVKWVKTPKVKELLEHSFPSIKDVIGAFIV